MPKSQLTRGVFACLLRGVAFDLVPRIEKNEGDPRGTRGYLHTRPGIGLVLRLP